MFVIQQSKNLQGTINVAGSKNAALPIIAANYLTNTKVTLTNLPDILDVQNIQIVGDEAVKKSKRKQFFDLTSEKCLKMRASILLIPYGLIKHGKVKFIGTGGCNLGKRGLDAFDDAFAQCGVKVSQRGGNKIYEKIGMPQANIIQKEFSVTTTEAILTYLAFLPGASKKQFTIHNAAIEPHVLNLIDFLKNAGATIEVNYDHSIVVIPQKITLKSKTFPIIGDMLEAGLYLAIGALAKGSDLTITGLDIKELLSTFNFARAVGIDYKIIDHQSFRVTSSNLSKYRATQIKTMIFPGFPTDLQSAMAVILTQAQGTSDIFERLFEGRFSYLAELEKLGAKTEVLNPHQAKIYGVTKFKGGYVNSTDLRGGGALVIAGIIATGKTYVHNEDIIMRGYDNIVKKLQSIGVKIIAVDG